MITILPVLVQVGVLVHQERPLLPGQGHKEVGSPACFISGHEIEERLAQHLVRLVAQDVADLRAHVGIDPPVVHLPDPVAGGLDEVPETLLALPQRFLHPPRLIVEPGVLDGDRGLAGKSLKQVEIAVGVGFEVSLAVPGSGRPAALPLLRQRHEQLDIGFLHVGADMGKLLFRETSFPVPLE